MITEEQYQHFLEYVKDYGYYNHLRDVCVDDPELNYLGISLPEDHMKYTKEEICDRLTAYYEVKTEGDLCEEGQELADNVFDEWERPYINKWYEITPADYRWLKKNLWIYNTADKLELV